MPGLVPSTEWKKARFKQGWHEGETMSVSIGQGYNLATPIQVAHLGRRHCQWRQRFRASDSGKSGEPVRRDHLPIPTGGKFTPGGPAVYPGRGAKRPGRVVSEEKGTARVAQLPNIRVAGKTGTAQVVNVERLEKEKKGAHRCWWVINMRTTPGFVGYAPADNPQVAVAVLLEHAGHGGSAAAPWPGESSPQALAERQPRVAKSE